MNFLLAGEGPSDLGSRDGYGNFKAGPMTWVIEALCKQNSFSVPYNYRLLTRKQLSKLASKISKGRAQRPEKKYAAFYDQAMALALETKKSNDTHGAVYFQDSDREDWEPLLKAVKKGFEKEQMDNRCVAMIPKPKSEAWLLAYFQKEENGQQAYNHAERFEDMSGNDSSPKSVKKKLAELLQCEISEIYERITEGGIKEIDWNRVDMPSFNQFKTDFLAVVERLSALSEPSI